MSDMRHSTDRLGDMITITPDPIPDAEEAERLRPVVLRVPKIIRIRETKPARWSAMRVFLDAGDEPVVVANNLKGRDSLFVKMRNAPAGAVVWLSPTSDQSDRNAIPLDAPDGNASFAHTGAVYGWATGADVELVVLSEINAEDVG